MNDMYDEKRGMVKKLLEMLKSHASDEVSNGLQKPDGEDDMHGVQVEKVEVLPGHEMDEPTPEHDVITKMADGGMAAEGDPELENHVEHKPAPVDPGLQEDMEALHPAPEEEEQPSMFASFLGKRKKK